MKKFFLFAALSLSLMGAAQAQNANGHFRMRYSGGVAETNLEAFCRTQLPKLCEGTTFEVTRDRVDQQGYRHVTMQQFVNGIRANGMTLNVHVFNGKITSINGSVLTQEMVPAETMKRAPRSAAQIMEMSGLSERLAEKAELVLFKMDGVSRLCYGVLDGDKYKHIDAFTGEVLSDFSIIRNAAADEEPEAAKGQGQTIFSGIQSIDIALKDGKYSLMDMTRDITTLNASMEVLMMNGVGQNGPLSGYEELVDYCNPFVNDSPDWLDPTFKSCLRELLFETIDESNLGKLVTAELIFTDYSAVSTDTVLIESPSTCLTLPNVIEYNYENELLGAGVFLIDPETGDKEQIGDYLRLSQGSNTKSVMFNEKNVLTAFNYFEGYTPAIDIHWGIAQVWDYYHDVFGYNSFDGNGTEVFCMVNPGESLFSAENACAIPLPAGYPGIMMYGMGGHSMYPVVDFTVTGHEFTHLVARTLATNVEDNATCHACALNESFADIMALAIYRHAYGKEIWGVGPDLMRHGKPLRRIDEPELNVWHDGSPDPYPSCYLDENFDIEKYEQHVNSTVQSHMFYLLVTGGEGINSLGQDYAVTPMDRTEAEQLAFTTLTEYVDNQISYEETPEAWITAAIQLFGENSAQLRSLCQAWGAVGLPQDDIVTIEQLNQDNNQKRGLRYNLQGQCVGEDYTGVVVEI